MYAEESEGWCREGEVTQVVPKLYILEVELDCMAVGSSLRVLTRAETEEQGNGDEICDGDFRGGDGGLGHGHGEAKGDSLFATRGGSLKV